MRRLSVGLPLVIMAVAGPSLALLQTGCSCRPDPLARKQASEEDILKRKKELEEQRKKKPDFEVAKLAVLPHDDGSVRNLIKPGHWFGGLQTMKANNFDFPVGQLDAGCVTRDGQPLYPPRSPFHLRTTRPVSLPKGTNKHFDVAFFAPRPDHGERPIWLQTTLRTRQGGREVWPPRMEPTTRLKPHQYYLVVLSSLPDSYGYLKKLKSVEPARDWDDMQGLNVDYVVVLPKGTRRVDLPSNPLTWTSIAYVIWDDFDPAILSAEQQLAMLDWIHWGGQLVVSGPRTLDLLKSSRFADYLPAEAGEVTQLAADVLQELESHWSLLAEHQFQTVPEKMPEIVQLRPRAQARSVPHTANLLVERRVGRGRIVATAFSMNDRQFVNWRSFDNFFNACLLRRPARRFYNTQGLEMLEIWSETREGRDDPRLTCKLRYFSRDAQPVGYASTVPARVTAPLAVTDAMPQSTARTVRPRPMAPPVAPRLWPETPVSDSEETGILDGLDVTGYRGDAISGVAGWNDFSEASSAARRSLDRAAGISVPDSTFIARVLGLYLLVLVPLNWGFFRLIGRVEWAWIAVPVLAMLGTVGVVRVAQLDIGFARSRTEVAVLETQPGYPRGHLTRYSGLYTSLSTTYDMIFGDPTAVVQPFSTDQALDPLRQDRQTVAMRHDKDVSLTDFRVLSNSTGMVHSEQMLELQGEFRLEEIDDAARVVNETEYDVRDAVVLRKTRSRGVEVSWIGNLESGTDMAVAFSPLQVGRVAFPQWERSTTLAAAAPPNEVSLRELADLACDPERLADQEVVLVGWTDKETPGMTIQPQPSQAAVRTLVVAHLRFGAWPEPRCDHNTFQEMARGEEPE